MNQSRKKHPLKVFALSLLAAMGLMASISAGAQAVTWDVAGAEIASTVTASGKMKAGTTALLLVPAQNLVIHCKNFTIQEGTLLTNNTAHAKLVYNECETKIKGTTSPGCKPEFLSIAAKILPILHNGRVYLLLEPLTGTTFTTLHFNEETCSLPPLPAISGSSVVECVTALDVNLSCAHPLVTMFIKPAPAGLFEADKLSYGLNPATVDNSAEIFLTGANSGKTFNALI